MPTESLPSNIFVYDSQTGYALKPGFSGNFPDSDIPIIINSKGLRDYEHSYKKNDSQIRILFIGDTASFGQDKPVEESVPKKVEELFRQKEDNVEVINGAVPGYQILSEHNRYFSELKKYDADFAVILVSLNDINYDNLTIIKENFDKYGDSGGGVPDTPTVSFIKNICHSCVFSYSVFLRIKAHKGIGNTGLIQEIMEKWSNPENSDFYDQHITNLTSDLKARNITVILVVPPYKWQLSDFETRSIPQTKLSEISNREKITLVELHREFMQGDIESNYDSGAGGMLASFKGNNIIASAIYDEIVSKGNVSKDKNIRELLR